MRVIDSSAWIEWFRKTSHRELLLPHWPAREETIVPTMVQFEIMRWAERVVSTELARSLFAYTQLCHIEALDTRIALRAVQLSREHKLAAADAIIYATALECGADCLTCDQHFSGLPDVVFIKKYVL